ncbi:MAG: sialidase family protein, partial [Thermoplasmata archaeon]
MIYRRVVFMCIAIAGLLLFPMSYLPREVGLDEVSVVVITDKDCYALGEMVTITLTNTGDETIAFLGVPPSWPDHSIWDDQMNPYYTISGINGSWVRMEPVMIIVATVVVDDFLLEPGESVDFFWNQTYLVYSSGEEGDEFYMLPPSWEQVPEGIYIAWAGGRMRVGDEVHLIGNLKEFRIGGCDGPETIEVSTDKYCYEIGEDVVITVEGRVWVPAVGSFPELFYAITNEKNESVVKPVNPSDQMYYFEGPQTAAWNQTYEIYELGPSPVPPSGEQVPAGLYYIWFYEVNFSEYYGIEPAEILIGACGGPIADAGPDQAILENSVATFNGSNSQGSKGIVVFGKNVMVNEVSEVLAHYGPRVVVDDNGVIHVAWCGPILNEGFYVHYQKSTDGGLTFQKSLKVSDSIYTGTSLSCAIYMDVDSKGNVDIVWTDKVDINPHMYYSTSTDNGVTFRTPLLLVQGNRSTSKGLLVDKKGIIHIVFYSRGNFYHIKSDDGGISFGEQTRINDVDGTSGGGRIALDDEDNIHAVWIDDRDWETRYLDIYYAVSTDGGSTFGKGMLV